MSNRPNHSKQRSSTPSSVAAARGTSGSSSRTTWIIGGVVIVVVAALLAAVLANGSSKASIPTGANAQAIVTKATGVPAKVYDEVGVGTAAGSLQATGRELRETNGKPDLLYIGAEYCPFCAVERWAVVTALARFGTFSDLGLARSSASDVYPDTPSLSFHGSSYTSKYIAFTGVETATSKRSGDGGYEPLDTPTPAQLQIQQASGTSSIPFFDVGGKYVSSGATYRPEVLQGESYAAIAEALSDPDSDVAKGAIGSANVFTAMICDLTGGEPGAVCSRAAVRESAAKLPQS